MKALVFMGSSREHSHTAALARAIADALESAGVEPEIVNTGQLGALPFGRTATQVARELRELRERVAAAQAVVLVSPVYHGGYSALLKAVLDELSGDAFADKPVAVAANGSGPRTGNVVCEQLRTVAKAMGAWLVPTQAASCPDDFLSGDGLPTQGSAELQDRCQAMAAELHRLAALFRAPAGV
ncbi:NAD(P)H-dependent FMN reductase [Kitasatospora sp. GAS204A]|uniref:NADPH-dependent FMN reductase n=1 Tax=unclassified Kitasatospora TaxID=2633591 RepID=UPI002476815D|nr:NADPH-dependent FMN reductase [Kitasatospora sp. GAS204B]MDH6117925.1 NAD(P)H-dependent FMN reductase [Kitasatospora sp. GAS204B]